MTATETKLIEVLTKGLKLQRRTPITAATAIFGKAATGGAAAGGGPGDGLGLDSVDVLEIAVLIDKHFGVMLEEANEEVRGALTNIGTLAAFIDQQSGGKRM